MHPDEIEREIRNLSYKNPAIRRKAARELTVHYLFKKESDKATGLIEHNNADVREGALMALREVVISGEQGRSNAWDCIHANIPYIIKLLANENENYSVRWNAAVVVSVYYVEKKELRKIHELLQHEDKAMRDGVSDVLIDRYEEKGLDISPFLSAISPIFTRIKKERLGDLLVLAAGRGEMKMVKAFVEAGADINAELQTYAMYMTGEASQTALMAAVRRENNMEVIQYLIEKGADPTIRRELQEDVGISDVKLEGTGVYESAIELATDDSVKEYLKQVMKSRGKIVQKRIDKAVHPCPKCGKEQMEWSFEGHSGQLFCKYCMEIHVALPGPAYGRYVGEVTKVLKQERKVFFNVLAPEAEKGKRGVINYKGQREDSWDWTESSLCAVGGKPFADGSFDPYYVKDMVTGKEAWLRLMDLHDYLPDAPGESLNFPHPIAMVSRDSVAALVSQSPEIAKMIQGKIQELEEVQRAEMIEASQEFAKDAAAWDKDNTKTMGEKDRSSKKEGAMDSVLSAFTKALEGGNEHKRWLAAAELTLHYLKKGKWKEIEELLEHRDAEVRDGTAHKLRQAGAGAEGASLSNIAPLVPALVRALKDKNVKVRRSAADALYCVSEIRGDVAYWESHYNKSLDLTPAIPFLTKAVEDDDSMVRYYVAGTIQHAAGMGLDITQSIPVLAKALEDSESLVRQYAVGALEMAACLGQDITPALSALGKISEKHSAFIFLDLRKGDWKKVEELIKSKDVGKRRGAVESLQASAHLDISPLIPTLGRALKDEVEDIRWTAARALRGAVNNGMDISSAVSNLKDALSDPYTIVIDGTDKHIIRRNASAALTADYINKKDWENVEGLLKHKDEEVKRGADIAFNDAVKERKEIPGRFDDFISPENAVLQDRDKRRKKLEELLRRDEDWTRVDIAQGLAASGHNGLDISSAISDLTNWLESKEAVLRSNAAETLGDAAHEGLDISSAIPALAKLLSDKDRFVIGAAAWGLVAHSINKKDWKNIEELLKHENDDVREGAVQAFQHTKADISSVVPDLANALSDRNSSIRLYAALALENAASWTDSDISPALPALKKALEDENAGVRDIAKMALEKIKE